MRILIIMALLAPFLFAAPAFHGKRTFVQPDGTTVEYRVRGDEYLHWNQTKDGDILLYSKQNKQLEHAIIKEGKLQASGVVFSDKVKSRKTTPVTRVSQKELRDLHAKKRQDKLSKIKRVH